MVVSCHSRPRLISHSLVLPTHLFLNWNTVFGLVRVWETCELSRGPRIRDVSAVSMEGKFGFLFSEV